MKKVWKRLIAVAVATLMLISMLPTAVMATVEQPATKVTINKNDGTTEKNGVKDAEFSFYRVISLTPSETPGEYSKFDVVNTYAEALSDVKADDLGNFNTSEIENVIAKLHSVSKTDTETGRLTTNEYGTGVVTGLPLGYYLVVETSTPAGYVASKPFMVAIPSTDNYNNNSEGKNWTYDITIETKNQKAAVDKVIANSSNNSELDGGKSDTVAVGDKVEYKITANMPNYDPAHYDQTTLVFKIHDKMGDGLKFNEDLVVKVGNKEVFINDDYELLPKDDNNYTFEISFTSKIISTNPGAPVEVTYSATVTDKAFIGKPNENNAGTIFGPNPGSTTEAKPSESAKVFTFALQINKKDENKKPLAGAEFELYKDDKTTKIGETVTTDTDGQIKFERLDAGTYYLKETKSPAGYTLLKDLIKVEIIAGRDANDKLDGTCTLKVNDKDVTIEDGVAAGIAPVTVINYKGFTLPETGGMGTYIFTIGGVILMAGAIILLLTMKKKKDA